ncbi:DUF2798 domain-containing protein [Flavobacterium soli]|uniref:DUF2798 domain-containing protein n=1 Tax=Flavobacterium soli TaxID=344881 RepID=UPI0003FAFEA3|nr:DUF2798 domain-containing protein [Flavobacterium soli]
MKRKIAFAMIMGVITTCIISFLLIAINIGFTEKFFRIWIKSWLLSYTIAIPAILIIAPRIERLVAYLFKEETNNTI